MKKQPRPSGFTPTSSPDRVLTMGDRLREATATLNQAATESTRAQQAAVEEERLKLQITITDAATQLALLSEFQRGASADIALLQSVAQGFDALRGQVDEAVRTRAAARVQELMQGISQTRDVLAGIEGKVRGLTWEQIQPRVWPADRQFPGILDRDGWQARVPTMIRLDLARGTKRVASLPAQLKETKQTVELLASAVEKTRRIRDKERGVVKAPVSATASIVPPEELAERAAARPTPPQQTADSRFTGYQADDFELGRHRSGQKDGPVKARPGETMADYAARANS